ncbi:MAG: glycosyltransferase family 4 protein [Acidobacteria bacterium]|jgi:glycosyltransferase involved in cell wall biosynthesis|nr:glycosyltransferase family 4 protein [Acidobacteriota bacterium]
MIKAAIVVQRYGKDVLGGAETLARDVAERLNADGFDVTVFTTTAQDYITWKNEYKPGESILKGVIIKRFNSLTERNIKSFNKFSKIFFKRKSQAKEIDRHIEQTEKEWIQQQGPYCPDLIAAIEKEQDNFDVFLFFTYLYYPTIEGLKVIKKPIVLFPTAHDEPPIYLKSMVQVFQRPEAFFFLTDAEMSFVKNLFNPPGIMERVRSGIEIHSDIDEMLFQRNFLQFSPYILYAGRIEKGKGLEPVFEAYREIQKNRSIEFILMGKKLMDIPQIEGLKYVGFVSEEEKLAAFKGALVSVQPSALESLSITTLESFSQKTPVLVNKESQALCEHIAISGGGVAYANVNEFVNHVYNLYDQKETAKAMGIKGYQYVEKYYSWDVVMDKIKKNLAIISAS